MNKYILAGAALAAGISAVAFLKRRTPCSTTMRPVNVGKKRHVTSAFAKAKHTHL